MAFGLLTCLQYYGQSFDLLKLVLLATRGLRPRNAILEFSPFSYPE